MLLIGDNRETLKEISGGSVDCCVTSPPYFGLRDYGAAGQIGLESTPSEYVRQILHVFGEVWRILADHGTLFLNLGDTYAGSGSGGGGNRKGNEHGQHDAMVGQRPAVPFGLNPKELVGIPWQVAFALQHQQGWYLRQDIIWHKPAPMPSSVRDRCTTAHEYIFLLTKRPKYYWDWYGISEPATNAGQSMKEPDGWDAGEGAHGTIHRNGRSAGKQSGWQIPDRRNKRSVWTINTESFKGAHFATFPRELPRLCITAGCPETVCVECGRPWVRLVETERVPGGRGGTNSRFFQERDPQHSGEYKAERVEMVNSYVDKGFHPDCQCGGKTRRGVVLDPFLGSGTTGQVAQELGREWIGCELNRDYVSLIDKRTAEQFLF